MSAPRYMRERVHGADELAGPYVDRDEKLLAIPPQFEHQTLIRTALKWTEAGKLLNLFQRTGQLRW